MILYESYNHNVISMSRPNGSLTIVGIFERSIILAFSFLLVGCASFSGRPEPVTPVKQILAVTQDFPRTKAILRGSLPNDSDRGGLPRRQWRDMVVDIYVHAADARYRAFLAQLSRQTKGVNLGHDLLIIGLSGGASIAGKSTANALSAAVAGLAGSRASISKELYFEKTLPALIAGMESARLKQKIMIYTKLRTEDVNSYPLGVALSDVDSYEASASLDAGIAQVTAAATAAAAEEQRKLDPLYIAPVATEQAIGLIRKIKQKLALWVSNDDKTKLNAAASVIAIGPKDDLEAQAFAITTYLGEHNSAFELNDFIARVQNKTGESF